MAEKKQSVNKQKKRYQMPGFYKVGFVFIAVFFFVAFYLYYHPTFSTQVIYHGTEEVVIPARGIAVWDEELLVSATKGMAVMNYSDGTRVTARTHVASVYSGDIDEAKSNSIKSLSEKINSLEIGIKNRNQDNEKQESSNAVLLKKMRKIAYYSEKGDFGALLKENNEIETMALGESGTTPEKELEKLRNQRDDVERTITGHKDAFYSKTSGIVYSKADGFETTINAQTVANADGKLFDTLWNAKPVDYTKTEGNYVFGKILNNYELTMLVKVNQKEAQGIENGDVIYVKAPDVTGGKIPGTVTNLVSAGGDYIITMRISKYLDHFMQERKMNLELIKVTYSGLRIPKEAVHDDGTGNYVMVIKDSVVKKKQVEVLCEKNEFVIVKEDNQKSSNVLLYDLVITKSKNLTEGMIVADPR